MNRRGARVSSRAPFEIVRRVSSNRTRICAQVFQAVLSPQRADRPAGRVELRRRREQPGIGVHVLGRGAVGTRVDLTKKGSYISGLLKHHRHETGLVVLESKRGAEDFRLVERRLREFEPTLVCHTAVATQYPFIANVGAHIRRLRPELCQLVGGVHASLNPGQAISDSFDAVCVGEGEYPTLELVSQLERGTRPSGIANLWIRTGDGVEQNAPRPFLRSLDSLPLPDREMWDEWLDHSRPPVHTVLLGRGCPHQCTYCCNHALRKIAGGPYVRFRDPDAIAHEVRTLAAPPDMDQAIYLEVETLMLDQAWTEAVCDRLAALNAMRQRPIRFGANIRVTPHANVEGFFQALARANVRWVNIGLESGSTRIRREVLKRYYSNVDVLRAVHAARTHGMRVTLYNLVGLPGETRADFLETARMNRLCRPDVARTSIFFPYPGTVLHQLCAAQGLLPAKLPTERERRQAVLDLPGFPSRQIQECYDHFDLYVACANPLVRRVRILVRRCLRMLDSAARHLRGYWFVRRRLTALLPPPACTSPERQRGVCAPPPSRSVAAAAASRRVPQETCP